MIILSIICIPEIHKPITFLELSVTPNLHSIFVRSSEIHPTSVAHHGQKQNIQVVFICDIHKMVEQGKSYNLCVFILFPLNESAQHA